MSRGALLLKLLTARCMFGAARAANLLRCISYMVVHLNSGVGQRGLVKLRLVPCNSPARVSCIVDKAACSGEIVYQGTAQSSEDTTDMCSLLCPLRVQVGGSTCVDVKKLLLASPTWWSHHHHARRWHAWRQHAWGSAWVGRLLLLLLCSAWRS